MKTRVLVLSVAIALLFGFLAPFASANSGSPNSCFLYQSNSNTSSDGSMLAKAFAYSCPGGASGQSEWEAFSGQLYVASGSITLCGTSHSFTSADDLQGGQAAYSSVCYWQYSYNFALNSLGSYSYTASNSGVTVNQYGWSGNCNNLNVGSACVASTSASAP